MADANPCMALVPGFQALNKLKREGDLCKVMGEIQVGGLALKCGSADYTDAIDRQALCALLCCCFRFGANRKQQCVADVLWDVDKKDNFKSYYKAEVPYGNLDADSPAMSGRQPERATRSRPGGSRIPDVVVVKNPDLAIKKDSKELLQRDNIQKVYEMKFPPDAYSDVRGPDGLTQEEAYGEIFGNKLQKEPLTPESCNCPTKESPSPVTVLDKAWAWNKEREANPNANAAAVAVLGATAAVLAAPAELLAGAAAAVGGAAAAAVAALWAAF